MFLDSPTQERFKSTYWWACRETKLQKNHSFGILFTISIALGGTSCSIVDAVLGNQKERYPAGKTGLVFVLLLLLVLLQG